MPHLDQELRTKYSDWCSARIAEHLLALSPEDVFLLSERGALSDATPTPDEASGSFSFRSGYSPAERTIRAAFEELGLPPFAEWAAEYTRDPDRFERDLLGFRTVARGGEGLPRTGT
ncbi:MAG TPA: hypothetical protein VGR37_12330 [Longimicrobiaceae bacterium]|nr:hypothetical protein [Longimicrobiaceae bacterium]